MMSSDRGHPKGGQVCHEMSGIRRQSKIIFRGNEEVSKGNEVNSLVPVEEENPIFDDWNFLWKSCHQEETDEANDYNYQYSETGKRLEAVEASSPSSVFVQNYFPKHEELNGTAGINSNTGAEYKLPPPSQLPTGNYSTSRNDGYSVPPARCSAVPSGLVEQIRNGLFTNLTGIAAACEATTLNTTTETATTGSIEGDYRQKQAHKKTSYPFASYNTAEQAVVGWSNKANGGLDRSSIPPPCNNSTEYSSDNKAERHNQQYRPSHSLPVSYLFGVTDNDQDNSHLYSYTVEEDIDIFDSNLTHNNNNCYPVLRKDIAGYHYEDKENTSKGSEAAVFESKRTFDKQRSNSDDAFNNARLCAKGGSLERDDAKSSSNYRSREIHPRPHDDRKAGLEKAAGANNDLCFEDLAASSNTNKCVKTTQIEKKVPVPSSFPTKDFHLQEKCVAGHAGKPSPVSHHQRNVPTTECTEFLPPSTNSPGNNFVSPEKERISPGNYLCSKHSGKNQSSSLSPQTKCNPLNITISDSWSYLPAELVAGSTSHNQTSTSSTPNSPPYHISRVPPATRRCSSARSTADRRRVISPKSSRRSLRQSFKSRVLAALSPSKSKPRHSSCSSSIGMGHGNRSRLDSKNSERGGGSKRGAQKDKSATVPTADFEWEATVAPCGKSNYIYSPHQLTKNANNNQKSSQKKEKVTSEKMVNQEKTKSHSGGPSLKILSSLPNLVVANVRKLSKSSNDQSTSSNSKKRNAIATSASTDQFPLYPFQWHASNNQSNHSFSTNDISQLNANHNLPVSANHSSAYINNNYEVTENINFRQPNRQMEEPMRITKDTKRYSWAVGDRDFDYLRYESDKFRNYASGKYGGLLSHSPIREVDYECEEMLDKQHRMPLTSRNNDNNNNSGTSNNNHNNVATENWLQEQRERNSGASGNHTCFSSENASRGSSSNSAMIPGSRNVQYSSDVPASCRRERGDQKSRHSSNNSNASFNNYNNSTNFNSNNHSSQNYHRYHQSHQNLPPNRINSTHNGSSNNHRMGRPHSVYVMNSDALENQIDPTGGGFNAGKFPLENNWNECNATPYTASQTLESPNNYAAVSSVGTESLNVTSIFGEGADTVTSSAYSSFADRAESCATGADDLQSHNYRNRVGGGMSNRGETTGHVMHAWNKEKATIIKLYEQKMAASEKRCRDLEEHYNNLCKTENPQMLREELRRKNSELSAAQNTIRNLSNVLSDKDAELLTVRDQMNSLNQEMQQQTLLIGQLHQKIADNQNSTNYYKAQLSQLQEELHKAFEETAQLKKEMENLKNMSVNSFDQCVWGKDGGQSQPPSVHEVQQQSGNKQLPPSSSSQHSSAAQMQQNDSMCGALSKKISQLERTLANVELEKTNQLKVFERERVCWLEEKEIVLQYQKQLQANYAHIDNVNKQLQKQVDKQQPTTAQSQQQHRQHYLQLQQHL